MTALELFAGLVLYLIALSGLVGAVYWITLQIRILKRELNKK